MQTILGANGVIGRALSRALYSYEERIRQVSRAPKRMHPTDDLVSADLLDRLEAASCECYRAATKLLRDVTPAR